MRIAIDCHTLEIENWAGKEQHLYNVVSELMKIDAEDEYVLYFRKPVDCFSQLPPRWRIRNFNLPTPLWQFVVLADALLKKIDLFFAPCTYLLPALNFFLPSVIIIFDLTTFLPVIKETHKRSTRWREFLLLKQAIKNSVCAVAISESTKNDAVGWFKIEAGKVKVIYPAANRRFGAATGEGGDDEIIRKYKLPEKYILTVGTLEPRKNHLALIDAFDALVRTGQAGDCRLVIAGKQGWFYQDIFRRVESLGLSKQVIFLGYVPDDDLPGIYKQAMIFVYPSLYEGFGIPVLEAMACGCPVITSNISSLPEVAGQAAVLIEPTDPGRLAEEMWLLLNDPKRRESMIERGYIQAAKFSWERSARELLAVFRSIGN